MEPNAPAPPASAPPAGTIELPVQLSFFGFPPIPAVARVREHDAGARFRRALAAFGAGLGLAILGVFIPIAHFVLVPGFLLGGILIAARRLREQQTLVSVRGTCPRCGLDQTFEAGGPWRGTARVTCARCSNTLDLNRGA